METTNKNQDQERTESDKGESVYISAGFFQSSGAGSLALTFVNVPGVSRIAVKVTDTGSMVMACVTLNSNVIIIYRFYFLNITRICQDH